MTLSHNHPGDHSIHIDCGIAKSSHIHLGNSDATPSVPLVTGVTRTYGQCQLLMCRAFTARQMQEMLKAFPDELKEFREAVAIGTSRYRNQPLSSTMECPQHFHRWRHHIQSRRPITGDPETNCRPVSVNNRRINRHCWTAKRNPQKGSQRASQQTCWWNPRVPFERHMVAFFPHL